MPPKPAPTHFLCIPLAGSQLVRSLAAFRADVTTDPSAGSYGPSAGPGAGAGTIPDRAVRPPGTLHLTLGVMSLRDEAVTRAVELLRTTRLSEVLEQARTASAVTPAARAMGAATTTPDGEGLSITLRGLSAMQSPSKTSVLYVPPLDPTLLLRRFCEALRARFTDAGFMVPEDRPLLLHATVVNTIYVKGGNIYRRGGKGKGKGRERLTLDARDIIDRYEDHVWVEGMPVESVRICRMGAKKVEGEEEGEEDEAYEVEAEVTF